MKENTNDHIKNKILKRSEVEWKVQFSLPVQKLLVMTESDQHFVANILTKVVILAQKSCFSRKKFGSYHVYRGEYVYTIGGIVISDRLSNNFSGSAMN
jgi:hypothetical protein